MRQQKNSTHSDVYQLVTDRIMELLNKGIVPWKQTWNEQTMPRNMTSNRPYHGINMLLMLSSQFKSPYWLTWKNIQELGGRVRQGEHGMIVVYWKLLDMPDNDNPGKTKTVPFLRYTKAWNLEQIDGVPDDKVRPLPEMKQHDVIAEAERIALAYDGPQIEHGYGGACYVPSTDEVHMPEMGQFDKAEAYYSTLFHELVHSTGHKSRLARHEKASYFGSATYAKEELVAEMGASYLCSDCGILPDTIDNTAGYIQGWLKALADDRTMVVHAASAASKAVTYMTEHTKPIPEHTNILEDADAILRVCSGEDDNPTDSNLGDLSNDPAPKYQDEISDMMTRMEAYEEFLRDDPVARATFDLGKRGHCSITKFSAWRHGEIKETLTKAEASALLRGREIQPSCVTADGRVMWEYVLDELSQDYGFPNEDDFIRHIGKIQDAQQELDDLKRLVKVAEEV